MSAKISTRSATAIVIANMIGTGVFTSLGFQLVSIRNTWSIIILWSLGALVAICGALSYAELGTKMNRSGGEYHYLSQIYNSFVGYLSGWASLTVGFAAPIALSAMAAGAYTQKYFGINDSPIASVLIVGISMFHMFSLEKSSRFQNITTLFKVIVMAGFIVAGLSFSSNVNSFDWSALWGSEIVKPSFAVALVYVTYSFSGWNAAAYIVDEIKNVKRSLPIALIGGTLLVSLFYLLIQIVFLKQSSLAMITGKVEIGQIVAENIFGTSGGTVVSALISLMLISSISAMVWVGPRVTKSMSEDYRFLSFLAKTNVNGIPNRAIFLQAVLALIMVFTGTFEQIIIYSGFILQLFVLLTVISLFFIRKKENIKGYKSPLYPIPQIIFISINVWILIYLIINQPMESLFGMAILGVGAISYFINNKMNRKISLSKIALLGCLVILSGCNQNHKSMEKHNESHGKHHHSAKEMMKHLDNKNRDKWQKPYKVIEILGDIDGKTIMDIGAGTGYFSFKLAGKGANVIAADVNQEYIDTLNSRKQKLNISDEVFETRKLPFNSPALKEKEVDQILIVDTYHHIQDRISYFKKAIIGIKDGGKLVVVDYKKNRSITDGPSYDMRLSELKVIEELKEAGFNDFRIITSLLPKQYIIEASVNSTLGVSGTEVMKNHWNELYGKDEYVFGVEPDKYFKKVLSKFKPGKILLPGEGEGRNAVYAAKNGWDVFAYDYSKEAKVKAERLAKRNNVNINYSVQDIVNATYPKESFDAVAFLFIHFEGQERIDIHKKLDRHLKRGGILIFECFSTDHPKYNKNVGPQNSSHLYSKADIQRDFPNYEVLELKVDNEKLDDKKSKTVDSSVLRFVGRKL